MNTLEPNPIENPADSRSKSILRSQKRKALITVVVPVFNEIKVLDAFYARIKRLADAADAYHWEIIFVDDGSSDGSYEKMVAIADGDERVRLIKFTRNFGHQMAITAGISKASGDAVAVIDADLQDPPEVIVHFVAKWEEGYDVIYGVRQKREGESKMKLLTAAAFYRTLRQLTNVDIPVDTGDFRLVDRKVVRAFLRLRERDRFVRGLVSWLGFKQIGVPYHRESRYAGETKYPMKKMIKFAIDGITSFSTIPLKLSTWLGYFASLFGFGYAVYVVIQKFLGNTVPGFATIIVGMFFLGGVQLICLGILGEYLARIFNETKRRPIYLIDEIYKKKEVVSVTELKSRQSSA